MTGTEKTTQPASPFRRMRAGFTLIELLIVVAILGTLATIASPFTSRYIERAKVVRAITDIRTMEKAIGTHYLEKGTYPDALADIGWGTHPDPWRNLYRYTRIEGGGAGLAGLRKDHLLVPLNSDFDLYSMGKDGLTDIPLSAPESADDIIRANDGEYVGLASRF